MLLLAAIGRSSARVLRGKVSKQCFALLVEALAASAILPAELEAAVWGKLEAARFRVAAVIYQRLVTRGDESHQSPTINTA